MRMEMRGIWGLCWSMLAFGCGGDDSTATGGSSSTADSSSEDSVDPTTESSLTDSESDSVTTLDSSSSSSESSSSESSSSESSSSESSSTDASSESSSSESSGTDTGSTTSASASVSATVSDSSSSSDSESATETDGDDVQYCQQECMDAADCCPEGVPNCPGEYPFNSECVDGLCQFGGCTSDEDCELIFGTSCEDLGDYAACVPLCDEDDDCLTDFGETCSGVTEDGQSFCTIQFGCTSDDDCQGFGVCDVDSGNCYCDDATVCPDGFDCAPLP